MLKTIVLLKRRPDLSFEAFTDHWRRRHAALVAELPGVRRYVQSHIFPALQPQPAPFDGVGEAWFDGPDALAAMLASPAYAALIEDEAKFLDRAALQALVVEEIEPLG